MATNEERLAKAREIASSAQTRRIQLDTKLENNQLQQQILMRRYEKAGVTPDELEGKIKELDLEITKGLDDLDSIYNIRINDPVASDKEQDRHDGFNAELPF
jgi:chromosome segregation ATPase